MTKRAIDTPIREVIRLPDGMAMTLSDDLSLPLSELVIEISFRCRPDTTRHTQINQATILAFARDALTTPNRSYHARTRANPSRALVGTFGRLLGWSASANGPLFSCSRLASRRRMASSRPSAYRSG